MTAIGRFLPVVVLNSFWPERLLSVGADVQDEDFRKGFIEWLVHARKTGRYFRMNLKKMALIAEVLGGVGIIISILYLAYEVSQNSESVELSHHLTLSDQYLALRQSIAEERQSRQNNSERKFRSLVIGAI